MTDAPLGRTDPARWTPGTTAGLTAKQVYDRHCASLASGDLDRMVADYACDAVVADGSGPGHGHEHVRRTLANRLATFGALPMKTKVRTAGDVVLVKWTAALPAGGMLVGMDTFVVRNELIVEHAGFSYVVPAMAAEVGDPCGHLPTLTPSRSSGGSDTDDDHVRIRRNGENPFRRRECSSSPR